MKTAKVTDKRVRIMNEIIAGIRVVKMYAWDHAFKKVIEKLRRFAMMIINTAVLCVVAIYKQVRACD